VLQAEVLDKTTDLGFSGEDVLSSREILQNFVSSLGVAITEDKPVPTDIQTLVYRIKNNKKALQDWQQDIEELSDRLQFSEQLKDTDILILEDILSLLDSQFVEDLQRLYFR